MTRVGPGTPAGALLRNYWQPVALADEFDGRRDVKPVTLLGERFVLFRDERARYGLLDRHCPHRQADLAYGRLEDGGLRCAFHGFAWNLDGSLKDVPARWDFPHIRDDKFALPELPVATWAGFVFINPDQRCAPFDDFIKDLKSQFERWDLSKLYKQAHVAKIMPANWKIAQEAFCEAYHVNGTHPQIMRSLGDVNSQVDVWDNCARVITPSSVRSLSTDT